MEKKPVIVPQIYPAKGYSHVVRTGDFVWTAGLVSHGADGLIVGRGDIDAQVECVYSNVKHSLASCGLGFEDVVKITMFATNILFRPRIMEARAKYFPNNPPVSSFIVVTALSTADQLFEMEVMAVTRG
ncbi:MAG: RidA family protein [Xanthobacteraceae bacterium]|nr:RidA family protein [Xanthobacteraceae bacterium]MBX3533438.1 RidA family protein [Xanthobacteraceae bacterium]MCW5676378.1 RidA family protein [Xanthobacteraceae bacterium]